LGAIAFVGVGVLGADTVFRREAAGEWASVPDALGSSGLRAELVPFKSSNDVLVALSSGAIDMGTAGYNNVA